MVANLSSPHWWWISFFETERSWRFDERCTAVFFKAAFVVVVYAPDCKKDLDACETCIMTVTKVLWEGRRARAKDFYITGDFYVELGFFCTDEDDNDELNAMYGPVC